MEKNRKQVRFLEALIILIGTGMFYFNEQGIRLGSFTLMSKLILGFAIIGIGGITFLIRPELEETVRVLKDSLVLVFPYLLTMFFSMILWMLNNCTFSDITRGISDPLYQLIGAAIAIAYVVMFRERAVLVQLISMVLANVLVILQNYIRVYGLVSFVKDLMMLLVTFGEDAGNMVAIEVHDLTFAIGLYLLYYLLKSGKIKHRWLLLIITGFFFGAGLKRIGAMALAAAFLLMLVSRILPENGKKLYLQMGGIVIIFVSIGYIWAIKSGLYTVLAEQFHINTMGRIEMNNFIDGYYSFSPLFFGYGLGYVSKLLLSGAASRVGVFLAIHNDLLRIYIEIGFWGYIGWLVILWIYKPWYFLKKRSFEMGMVAFALSFYCFVTYLTDNTYYYFYTNLAAFTLILSCGCDRKSETAEDIELETEDQEDLLWRKH